jgi:hypothetical protein
LVLPIGDDGVDDEFSFGSCPVQFHLLTLPILPFLLPSSCSLMADLESFSKML